MLDLEKLFKMRPFVYYIRDDYYAFGDGVCTKCNNKYGNPATLLNRFNRYIEALKSENISKNDAWEVYRKVNSVAENKRQHELQIHAKEDFDKFEFTNDEKDEIQRQLEQVVKFFVDNHLSDYFR